MLDQYRPALELAHSLAADYLDGLAARPVARGAHSDDVAEGIDVELTDEPVAPAAVVGELAAAVEPGLVAIRP